MPNCAYQNQCGGCPAIATPLALQKQKKISFLSERLRVPEDFIQWTDVGFERLRDRVDLTWMQGQGLGLYHLDKYEIVDLKNCPMMSESLEKWFKDFRRVPPPIQKGSVRLRTGPGGVRGVWLDFANVDVKALLDEKTYLQTLRSQAHVEVGQKRKVLGMKEGEFKLLDPEPRVWFQTFVDEKPVDLKCSIADFTQVSVRANQFLIRTVMERLKDLDIQTVAEFGPGIGNFTLPLSAGFSRVLAFEMDRNAGTMLDQNLRDFGTRSRVEILQGDYQKLNEKRSVDFSSIDAVVVDPPRSGLKEFIDPLLTSVNKPRHFVYISCFPESFAVDLERLKTVGYRLIYINVVNQFPHSPHMELVAHLSIDAK